MNKISALRMIEDICANETGLCKTKTEKKFSKLYTIAHAYGTCKNDCPVKKEGKRMVLDWLKENNREVQK